MTVTDMQMMELIRACIADGSPHMNEIFQQRPLLAYLREQALTDGNSNDFSGGTFIQTPIQYSS